jgi:hypothetical protein
MRRGSRTDADHGSTIDNGETNQAKIARAMWRDSDFSENSVWKKLTMATAKSPVYKLNKGIEMPALGLGVFRSEPVKTVASVRAAVADGYRLPASLNFTMRVQRTLSVRPSHCSHGNQIAEALPAP